MDDIMTAGELRKYIKNWADGGMLTRWSTLQGSGTAQTKCMVKMNWCCCWKLKTRKRRKED